jgi:hypothetical protein
MNKILNQNFYAPENTTDDSGAISSNEGSLDSWKNESYITVLAADLFNRVSLKGYSEESLDRLFKSLPALLKTFALRAGFKSPSQTHGNVMYFVHKYRKYVRLSPLCPQIH